MPELPEVELYLHALEGRVPDQPIERVRIASVSLLKTVDPPVSEVSWRLDFQWPCTCTETFTCTD